MPQKINIFQLVQTLDVERGGGVTRAAVELAQNLDPEFFQSRIFSMEFSNTEIEKEWVEFLTNKGISTIHPKGWNNEQPYKSFLNSYRVLKSKQIWKPSDVLHSHSEFTDIHLVLLKLQNCPSKMLRTTHYGYLHEWRRRPIRRIFLTNFLLPLLLDLELGVNPTLVNRLNERTITKLMGRKSIYINEAVDLNRFYKVNVDKSKMKLSLGVPPEATLIGSMGRLVEQKGYAYLIEAARQVITSDPSIFFIIIGDGPLAQDLVEQVERYGISKNVVFAGMRFDVEQLLPCLDVFVLASLWEGMPISILESMASNVPVIASDVPGINDLIKDNYNGLLVPSADPQALSRVILRLVDTKSLRETLIVNSQATLENYAMSKVAEKYAEIYRSLA